MVFEGNAKVSDKDLTKEVQIKPRAVFTRAKVQADVQRIIELYRRNGKFAARVDPQIIQRPQNRVDLIFSITEGPTTGVARINFIGNKIFDGDTLKGQIATEESAWWKFLASNDNYDPDRLHSTASSCAAITSITAMPTSRWSARWRSWRPTARVSTSPSRWTKGARYNFGKITINSKIRELPPPIAAPAGADRAAATSMRRDGAEGDRRADQRGRHQGLCLCRSASAPQAQSATTSTIDLSFEIVQGPRVYIEKINIAGNTRTLDKVIRREFRLAEGDAFNRVLIDRSRTRIRGLGFFKDVDVKNVPGSQPDRTDLTVDVTEQSTGSLQLGLGYSSTSHAARRIQLYRQQSVRPRPDI